ncbi:MAG: peptidyl-prolyl cis-trans isomerase D [Gammaproteobacteria bacterium]|jgi:peptidyl-prolyl cis-trans isomerase D
MLQAIRSIFTGWMAVLFVGLLIIPFAFWGIDSYFNNAANISAANVNSVNITLAEYQKSFQNIRRQLQNISPALAEQNDFIQQQTLDKLVERILLMEIKGELGLRVSEDQIRSAIYEIPAFNNPEGFAPVAYQNYLLSSGYTPTLFEAELREDMSLEQLQAGILATTIVTPDELKRIVAFEKQTRDIQYTTISYDSFREQMEVSNSEIQTYYDDHTSDFTSPEQVNLSYLLLSIDSVAQEVDATEEDILAYFENFRQNYSVAERRKVRQILIYAEGDENMENAANVADQIYELIANSDSSFEDAQNQFDSDEITVEASDFGFLNEGVLDTEIDEVVFSAEIGVVSRPILSEYGYQIVVVDEATGGDSPTFDQVSVEVETDYRRELAEKKFFQLYDELAVLTFEHPESLELASESLGLPVLESGLMSQLGGSNSLLSNQKVIAAAFSDEVLIMGNNSDLIELDSDRIVVIRVQEHNQQQVLPLSEVRETIEARLLFEKGSEKTQSVGQEIIAKLEQNIDPAALAMEYSIIWAERNGVRRDNTELDRNIIETVFNSGRPQNGNSVVAGSQLIQGDYAVVRVNTVTNVESDSISEEDIVTVKNRVSQNRASKTWSSIISDLRTDASIEIYENNLN